MGDAMSATQMIQGFLQQHGMPCQGLVPTSPEAVAIFQRHPALSQFSQLHTANINGMERIFGCINGQVGELMAQDQVMYADVPVTSLVVYAFEDGMYRLSGITEQSLEQYKNATLNYNTYHANFMKEDCEAALRRMIEAGDRDPFKIADSMLF